jgi:hypothetical protein
MTHLFRRLNWGYGAPTPALLSLGFSRRRAQLVVNRCNLAQNGGLEEEHRREPLTCTASKDSDEC